MELQEAFERYDAGEPGQHAALQHTLLALRRGGVQTLEELWTLYLERSGELERLRGIGPSRMQLIGAVLRTAAGARDGAGMHRILEGKEVMTTRQTTAAAAKQRAARRGSSEESDTFI